jgi:hypothetical protein
MTSVVLLFFALFAWLMPAKTVDGSDSQRVRQFKIPEMAIQISEHTARCTPMRRSVTHYGADPRLLCPHFGGLLIVVITQKRGMAFVFAQFDAV